MDSLTFAVDFDGTCVDHRFPEVGPDVPNAVRVMLDLVAVGATIYLWTVRSGEYLVPAVRWFIERGIPLSGINSNPGQITWSQSPKCYAMVYVDDSAFGAPLIEIPGFTRKVFDWLEVEKRYLRVRTVGEIMDERRALAEKSKEGQ